MYPFRAVKKEDFKNFYTGDVSQVVTELTLDSLADKKFEHCVGRVSTCKCWNKSLGDYILDCYTFIKPKYDKDREDGFYEEEYYFHTKEESDEFHTALSKIMNGKAPF